MRWYIVCILLFFCTVFRAQEKQIVIIITSYNNIKWYKKNLDSVHMQRYTNYHVLYLDDCSTDGTADAVQTYIATWHLEDKITIVKNSVRRGQLYNIYIATHCCPHNAIIVTLDGDDWFAHENVLSVINHVYDNPNVLMTYGQFTEYPKGTMGFCREIPDIIKKNHAYRYYDWITSHVRTFYAALFKEIPVGCFIKEDDFIRVACDHAFMFPLLELSAGNASFINEVLYIYNVANSNNVFRKDPLQQLGNAYWIRGQKQLQPLSHDPRIIPEKLSPSVYNIHFSFGSTELCTLYLNSLATAGIDPASVIILYDAQSIEIEKTYKNICTTYEVSCFAVDNFHTCKEQLSIVCEQFLQDTFLLLTSDGCLWSRKCDFDVGIKLLRQTKALGYSYMYEPTDTIDTMPPHLVFLYKDTYVWKYADNEGVWHVPYSADAALYSLKTIQPVLNRINTYTVYEYAQKLSTIPTLWPDDVGVGTINPACQRKSMKIAQYSV